MTKKAVVFTDIHIGEGSIIDDKPNPIEYFEDDKIMYNAINKITEQYKSEPLLFIFNGDTFDFLTVRYKGKIQTKPTEKVASYKIRKIAKGHPLFIKALQKILLKNRDNKIIFIIGNHDLHLVFQDVQKIIKNKIANTKKFGEKNIEEVKERIEFKFKLQDDDVLFIHGNDSEPKNVTPNPLFITKHNFRKLSSPYLNLPFGAYMTEYSSQLATGNWFCKGNNWIGRMEGHGYVFIETFLTPRKWNFIFHAVSVLITAPLYFKFSSRWWIRYNATFWQLLKLVFKASFAIAYQANSGINYARKLMQENPTIKNIFIGHEHKCQQIFFPEGKIIYPGNWSTTYEANYPPIELKWKRFKWLEKIIRKIERLKLVFGKKTRAQHTPKRANLYSFGLCTFYKNKKNEAEIMRYDPEKDTIEPL